MSVREIVWDIRFFLIWSWQPKVIWDVRLRVYGLGLNTDGSPLYEKVSLPQGTVKGTYTAMKGYNSRHCIGLKNN